MDRVGEWRMRFGGTSLRCCPSMRLRKRGGRPRANLRQVMDGIFYVLRTGCQWKAIATRVRQRQHGASLLPGVDRPGRVWQGVAANARALRPTPSHRLELAERRWLDDQGAAGRGKKPAKTLPIAVSWASNGRFSPTAAACRWVWRLAAPTPTIRSFSSRRSTAFRCRVAPIARAADSICVSTRATTATRSARRVRRRGYVPHIRSRGEEQSEKRMRGKRPRRWVVERVASWLNRYRRILVRWEKKAVNYEALLHLVFAHILWRNS